MERRNRHAGYSYADYRPTEVKESPKLGVRLKKLKKEELDARTTEFIDSLLDFFNKNGGLSERQLTAFEKIESRFSPHEKAKLETWKKSYLENHIGDAKIVARYYVRTGYFTNLADNILNQENFIPSPQNYNKMISNKYAQRVLTATKDLPRFSTNAMVQLRSTVGKADAERNLRPLRSRLCFVLANDLPVINATAGAKRYKVLPMGASNPVEIDEKHLMKPNKKGRNS